MKSSRAVRGLVLSNHGFWMYRPSMKGLPPGTPRPKSIFLGTRDLDEAVAKVLELRGQGFAAPNAMRPLREWVNAYQHHMASTGRHRPTTAKQVAYSLDALCASFGDLCDPARITRDRARAWVDAEAKRHDSESLAHQKYRNCRGFFTWLVESKGALMNPFLKLDIKTPTKSRRERFCTAEERDRLFAACDRDDLRYVLAAGFFGGMRINEIVNSRWDWFQLHGGGYCTVRNLDRSKSTAPEVRGFKTKPGKERLIPMHIRLRQVLESMEPGDGYVLHPETEQGKAHLRWDPRCSFRRLAVQCGVPWVSFHVMRHTFGSLHAIAGTPEIKIRRWMGITQEVFDRYYAGLRPDDSAINAI